MTLYDKRGREILPGSYIVYGHALGRCAALRFGKVLRVKEGTERVMYGAAVGTSITVIGVDDDQYRYVRETDSMVQEPPKLCSKPGNLQFPPRMMVVDKGDLPAGYQALLDGYPKARQSRK